MASNMLYANLAISTPGVTRSATQELYPPVPAPPPISPSGCAPPRVTAAVALAIAKMSKSWKKLLNSSSNSPVTVSASKPASLPMAGPNLAAISMSCGSRISCTADQTAGPLQQAVARQRAWSAAYQAPAYSSNPTQASTVSAATITAGTSCSVISNNSVDEDAAYQRGVLNRLRISWGSIQIGRVLGEGGFGTVTKGIWQGNAVAVKRLNIKNLSSPAQDQLRQEALAMCELRHPCIAHVYGLVDEGPHSALVMRYYRNGTLAAAINNPEYANLEMSARLRMAQQVASGMCCLHERNVIHGDLKTSNLLIEDDGRGVVIADFGLSRMAGQVVAGGALTPSISPPEVLLDPSAPRTPAGDVYAFSIVLLEIVSGRFVYKNMKPEQLKTAVCSGRRAAIPACIPDDVAAIISACWEQQAADRPTFPAVLKMLEEAALENAKGNTGRPSISETVTGQWALRI